MYLNQEEKKIKILYVVHEKNCNGSSKSLLDFLEKLSEEYGVYVLSRYKDGPLIEKLKELNVKTYYFPFWEWRIHYRKNDLVYKLFKKIIYIFLNFLNILFSLITSFKLKKLKINIVHTNTSVIAQGALIARILKVKHIWHIREFGEEDFGFLFVFPKRRCYRFMNKNTSLFIYNSKAVQEKYSEFLDESKGKLLYNCINRRYINQKSYRLHTCLNMLICGSIVTGKGQDLACEAVKNLIDKQYTQLKLFIAGSGKTDELTKYIKELKIERYVIVLGRVENMVELRKKMDIELVCSRCEAFGRVTVEAMMSGNPVIGSNSGGTRELIQDGYNGLLFENGNVSDLEDKIQFFYNNKMKIGEYGKNAYSSVVNKYKVEEYISELVKIYQSI